MRERVVIDPITRHLRIALFSAWRNKYAYCRKQPPEHVDHIFPVAKGGPDRLENYVAACQPCNAMKSYLLLAEGYLRILEAKATRMAPRIRLRIAQDSKKLAGDDLLELLVTSRMLARHTQCQLSAYSGEQIQALRRAERAEVEAQFGRATPKQVMVEISRIKAQAKDRSPNWVT